VILIAIVCHTQQGQVPPHMAQFYQSAPNYGYNMNMGAQQQQYYQNAPMTDQLSNRPISFPPQSQSGQNTNPPHQGYPPQY
jgi:hypothetical protein